MIERPLFDKEPIGNIFYPHTVIFEIPILRFLIKPPACWGADVSTEIYKLLLLFSIISLCKGMFSSIAAVWFRLEAKFSQLTVSLW